MTLPGMSISWFPVLQEESPNSPSHGEHGSSCSHSDLTSALSTRSHSYILAMENISMPFIHPLIGSFLSLGQWSL